MIRPVPRICMTCCTPVEALVSLFANAVGWLSVCESCALAAEQPRWTAAALTRAPTDRHPPSDGAHRLAWWLAGAPARLAMLADTLGMRVGSVHRLMVDVEPTDEIAFAIAHETQGAVLTDDWRRGGPLGWLERPRQRDDGTRPRRGMGEML